MGIGIVGFNSSIPFPRRQVVPVLHGFYRVLRPHGVLLLSLHAGQEVRRVEEWWGKLVSLEGVFFEWEEMEGDLRLSGVGCFLGRTSMPQQRAATRALPPHPRRPRPYADQPCKPFSKKTYL
jgi:hypothetical protein